MSSRALHRLLHPPPGHALGRFAFVMATGIVGTLVHSAGATVLGDTLFAVAAIAYLALTAVGFATVRGPAGMKAEIAAAGFTAMTVPAGTSALAGHLALRGATGPALAAGAVAMVTWVVLVYLVPAQRVLDNTAAADGDRLRGADGTWFLWGVSTQSVAVVAGLLAPQLPGRGLGAVAALWWGLGTAQLVLVAALVAARMMLSPLPRIGLPAPRTVVDRLPRGHVRTGHAAPRWHRRPGLDVGHRARRRVDRAGRVASRRGGNGGARGA